MGKVKGEEKFSNEVLNKRRKKRRKELDLLRRKVLETKRKLREKNAPPKTHVSTFDKILHSFADRRQDNDNKTQGFDSKGRKAGVKKLCTRLLPSRKPQVGIFANGTKGAEIKRVNLSLNETDKARFESDLQKVLSDGKRKSKESKSEVLDEILHIPSAERIDVERQEFIQIQEKKLDNKPQQNFLAERQGGKRKLDDMPMELDVRTVKKPHSEKKDTKVLVQYTEVKSEGKISRDKKWKRSLFQDEVDDFEPISELCIEELRFSPIIGKAEIKIESSEPEVFPNKSQEIPASNRLQNFNYGQFGRMAATKYEELCAIVCAENFDTCLQEIPHNDPLTKVKQSLNSFYAKNCSQKRFRNDVKTEGLFADDPLSTNSNRIHSNVNKNGHFNEKVYLGAPKLDTVNVLPLGDVRLGNLKNFSHQETGESSSSRRSKPVITKPTDNEIEKSGNNSFVTRGNHSSENNPSSLDVNYDSSRKSFGSNVLGFSQIDGESGSSVIELDGVLLPRIPPGIPSYRKRTMQRYLNEVNNSVKLKEDGSICQLELSAVSAADNNDVQKCYLGDPSRIYEIRRKQTRNPGEKKLEEMREPSSLEAGIAEKTLNPFDANCSTAGTCSGLDIRGLEKIEGRTRRTVINLSSASSSTLARIPSDRGEIMLKFLQGVNNQEPRNKDRATFLPEVFVLVPENDKLQKPCICDSLTKRGMKNNPLNRPMKNERHVPAILRKSQATKRNKKSNTLGNVLVKGGLEFGNVQWKTLNFGSQKVSSEIETTTAVVNNHFEKKQTLRKPPSTASLFNKNSGNSAYPESVDMIDRMPQSSQFQNQSSHLDTPKVVNDLYELKKKTFDMNRNFMNERFPSEIKRTEESTGGVNFLGEFRPQSTRIFRHKNSADNVGISKFHNEDRRSLDLPIFENQRRQDPNMGDRIPCDDKANISSLGNLQESQRFPVYLKRKTVSSTRNRIRHKGEHQTGGSPENGKSKVIIIQNPNLRGYGEAFKREMNIPITLCNKNGGGNLRQGNGGGLPFPKFSQGLQTPSMNQVQIENGRQKTHPFQIPDAKNWSMQNLGDQVEIPRCVWKTDSQREHRIQLPSIMYENEIQKVVHHKYRVQKLGNNPINCFAPRNFEAPGTAQGIFQQVPSSKGQIPASCVSSYRGGNTNLETHRDFNKSVEPVQSFDRRTTGFGMTKNETESSYRNAMNIPMICKDQSSRGQNYGMILSRDANHNYKYIIDPRCPQVGYKWNQIDQNGAQIHQHVIQPAYNVTDAYRPQHLPHNYFSTDS